MTLDELARDAKVSEKTMKRFIEENAGLTFIQLRRIADYFGRGVLFFLEQGPAEAESVHTVQYRTLTGKKPDLSFEVRKLIERVERQRDLYLALRDEMSPEDYPTFSMPDLNGADIAEKARKVRHWLGLDGLNTFEMYRAAVQAKGILVFRTNGYAGQWQIPKDSPILGFNLFDERCPSIVVKKATWETQQTFTLMHELGHVLLHRESSIDDDGDMQSTLGHEREANAFAGRLLVPDEILTTIDDNQRPDNVSAFETWLAPQRRRLGVSAEVLLRRLLDEERLTQAEYVAYREYVAARGHHEDDGGNRQYRHREPKHIFGEMYVRTVLDALHARRISITKASSYLDRIKLSDIHQLERHLASS